MSLPSMAFKIYYSFDHTIRVRLIKWIWIESELPLREAELWRGADPRHEPP